MNKQNGAWLTAILGVVLIILVGILIFVPAKKSITKPPVSVSGIEITTPKLNEVVSSPIKITGTVNGGGWGGFEGQVGYVDLLDYKGNNLGTAVLKTTTDWTISPTNFEATITLGKVYQGLANLVFHNENPSGMPQNDKTFSLPVAFK